MARDSDGVANLFVAIEQNDHDRVKHFMEAYHISPNAHRTKVVSQKETQTYTPLYLAASLDRSRICDLLLSRGADPYGKMVYGMYPIHVACDRVFVSVLEVFLQHSCDLNRKDDNGDTPLHLAALRGSVECVHLLTIAGADLDARNKAGKTPIDEAVQHQRWDVVKYLRDHCVSKQKFPGVQGSRNNTQDDSGTKDPHLVERERLRANPSLKAFKSKSKSCDYPEVNTSLHHRPRPHQPDGFPRTIVAGTFRRRYDPSISENGTGHISMRKKIGAVTANGSFSGNGHALLPDRMQESHGYGRRMQKRQSWPSISSNLGIVAVQPSADDEDEECSGVLHKKVLRKKVDGLLDLLVSDRDQAMGILSAPLSSLLPPLACCLKLSPMDVNSVCKGQGSRVVDPASPDHSVLQSADLMKEWGYTVLDETPFRVELENALLKVYFHVKIKNESLLRRVDSQCAVLEMVAKCNDDDHLEEDIGCYGSLIGSPVLSARHTNLCSVYYRYHGSTAGFRRYLETTGIAGNLNLPARAQFSFRKNYKCTLKQLLERRDTEVDSHCNILQGFKDIDILAIAFQLLLVMSFLEENGVEGLCVSTDSVCITEEGTVLLDAEQAARSSNLGKETDLDYTYLEEENGYPETGASMQSIGKLCQELMQFTPLSLPSAMSSACSGSTLAASLSHSNDFLSFLRALAGSDCAPLSPCAGLHIAYCLLQRHSMSLWTSESKCQRWLASERLTLYFSLTTGDEGVSTDVRTVKSVSFFQRRLIDYLFLLQADAKDLWCAVQTIRNFTQ